MIAEQIPAVAKLSLEQKWQLASELWEEVERNQEQLASKPEIEAILAQRFEAYERDPSTSMTLDDFKRHFRLP